MGYSTAGAHARDAAKDARRGHNGQTENRKCVLCEAPLSRPVSVNGILKTYTTINVSLQKILQAVSVYFFRLEIKIKKC